jgi:hypothetical protein
MAPDPPVTTATRPSSRRPLALARMELSVYDEDEDGTILLLHYLFAAVELLLSARTERPPPLIISIQVRTAIIVTG